MITAFEKSVFVAGGLIDYNSNLYSNMNKRYVIFIEKFKKQIGKIMERIND